MLIFLYQFIDNLYISIMKPSGSFVNLMTAISFLTLALFTLIPFTDTSKENMLGYDSLCPYVPVSTIVLLGFSLVYFIFTKKS